MNIDKMIDRNEEKLALLETQIKTLQAEYDRLTNETTELEANRHDFINEDNDYLNG